jgi:hypothetical protein
VGSIFGKSMIPYGEIKCPKLRSHSKRICCSPSGNHVVSHVYGNLSIFCTKTFKCIKTIIPIIGIGQYCFLDDHQLCYSQVVHQGTKLQRLISICDMSGNILKEITVSEPSGVGETLDIVPMNNGHVAIVSHDVDNGTIILLNLNEKEIRFPRQPGHHWNTRMSKIVFSRDGSCIYFLKDDKIHIWNLTTNSLVGKLNLTGVNMYFPGRSGDELIVSGPKQILIINLKNPKQNFGFSVPFDSFGVSSHSVTLIDDKLFAVVDSTLFVFSGYRFTTVAQSVLFTSTTTYDRIAVSKRFVFADHDRSIKMFKIRSDMDLSALSSPKLCDLSFHFVETGRNQGVSLESHEPVDDDPVLDK